ncbi:hypothetical protein D3C84_599740 [compost metagenome]
MVVGMESEQEKNLFSLSLMKMLLVIKEVHSIKMDRIWILTLLELLPMVMRLQNL